MPERYPGWDMSDEVRGDLSRHLDAGMEAGLYAGVPPGDAIEELLRMLGRDRLVEALSGTTDKRSREWRNARDNLSRYRRGARRPQEATQQRMRAAAEEQRRAQVRTATRAHVRLNATFKTSRNTWGLAYTDLTGPDLEDFMAAREAGNDELAAQIVTDAYGLDPAFVLGLEGVSGFEITWDIDESDE